MSKTITKQEFEDYERVRASGVTNMYAVNIVSDLSGLDRETIIQIMKEYEDLEKRYPEVRQ